MNPYSVMIAPHPIKARGWLVIIEFTMDSPPHNRKKGEKLARRYHYKREADLCGELAIRNLSNCPEFYPIPGGRVTSHKWTRHRVRAHARKVAMRLAFRGWSGRRIYNRLTDLALRAKTPVASVILYSIAEWAGDNL